MLLAGKGSTLPSNYANVPGISCEPASGRSIATVPCAVSQPPSRAGSPAPQVTTTTSVGVPPPGVLPSISNRPTPTTTTGIYSIAALFLSFYIAPVGLL